MTLAEPTSRLLAGIAFAAQKHREQRRKDAESSPYINHPIQVADLIARIGGVTDLTPLLAAVLHDTIEDTETTAEELVEAFGADVARVVLEVTDDITLPSPDRKRLQVEHAPHLSPAAKLVKLCDKIANLLDVLDHPPPSWSAERRLQYFDWAKAVVDGLRGANAPLEAMFDAVYARRSEIARAA